MNLPSKVLFVDEKVRTAFQSLDKSDQSDRELKEHLIRAFEDLEKNSFCGIQIPKRLIPKEYLRAYKVDNLWKYNLPGAWRLLYSVASDEIKVISIVLEWMDHNDY